MLSSPFSIAEGTATASAIRRSTFPPSSSIWIRACFRAIAPSCTSRIGSWSTTMRSPAVAHDRRVDPRTVLHRVSRGHGAPLRRNRRDRARPVPFVVGRGAACRADDAAASHHANGRQLAGSVLSAENAGVCAWRLGDCRISARERLRCARARRRRFCHASDDGALVRHLDRCGAGRFRSPMAHANHGTRRNRCRNRRVGRYAWPAARPSHSDGSAVGVGNGRQGLHLSLRLDRIILAGQSRLSRRRGRHLLHEASSRHRPLAGSRTGRRRRAARRAVSHRMAADARRCGARIAASDLAHLLDARFSCGHLHRVAAGRGTLVARLAARDGSGARRDRRWPRPLRVARRARRQSDRARGIPAG